MFRQKLFENVPFILFIVSLATYCGLIVAAPLLAMQGNPASQFIYDFFAPQCHQLTSRSLCIFAENGSYWIGDCMPSARLSFTKQNTVEANGAKGFKFGVCARDSAIFFAMLLGGLAVPFILGSTSTRWPSKWILAAAAVPIAIDGLTQLLGLRESTNFWRLLTGSIIGFTMPFYIIPILNQLWSAFLRSLELEPGEEREAQGGPVEQTKTGKNKRTGKRQKAANKK